MINAENVLICIAVPLTIILLFTKGDSRRLIVSFITGMVVCVLSAYIAGFFQMASGFSSEETSIFLSPIIEECMKLLSILFCIYVFEPSDEEIQLFSVGIAAGFVTFENCCSFISSGATELVFVFVRGIVVGVMHVVTMVAVAKGLLLLKKYKVFSFAGVIGVLSISSTVHGLYNLLVSEPGISSYIAYAMPMVAVLLLFMVNCRQKGCREPALWKRYSSK